jgi:hypothetical protein
MRSSNDGSCINCGCVLAVLIMNIVFGAMSVNYLLSVFAEKTLPFFWAMVIGLFAGQFTVPVAIIVWVLERFSVI